MPKYIEKDKLPQFKYYNFCEGVHDYWGEKPEPYAAYHLDDGSGADMKYMGKAEDIDTDLAGDDFGKVLDTIGNDEDDTWVDLHLDWMDSVNGKKGKQYNLLNFMYVVLYAMHKDRYTAKQWKERFEEKVKKAIGKEGGGDSTEFMLFLSMADEYLKFASTLRTCQGFPLTYRDGDVVYPKMLLIESGFYKSKRDSSDLRLDYGLIKSALRDACYVISINGECAERKMCFCLADAGSVAVLNMLDPNNGQTRFFLKPYDKNCEEVKEYEKIHKETLSGDAMIVGDAWRCHPRGDYWCNGKGNYCVYCDGKHSCKYKSLNIAAAILYCFQEYIRKVNEAKTTDAVKRNGSEKADGRETKALIPSGMIRMYDIKYSKEEMERFNKFALFGRTHSEYPSTEKAPHVRRGTMRFNPKTGQKDIQVRGSIIHKDKYQGFASAERLCE